MSKLKKPSFLLLCSAGGLAYFNAIASMDIYFVFKSYLILFPIASSILIYFWLQRRSKSEN